ncbi:MAG: hypothetical protein K2X01_09380 [Cyanobacteria bacterium]|nr:hypothetical protein [Cyanobacteriota bacterium]
MLRLLCLIAVLFKIIVYASAADTPKKPDTTVADVKPAKVVKYPIVLDVLMQKDIFTMREGINLTARIKAMAPTDLCLEKDPLTQFDISVTRSGFGLFPLDPLTVKDLRVQFQQRIRVMKLKPGDVFVFRFNLKRFTPSEGADWESGDYQVKTAFRLCEQVPNAGLNSAGREIPVPARKNARFFIMN